MKTNLIYYPGGCYGTFIEWCCNFFSVDSTENEFPFNSTGSSHKFDGNFLFPHPVLHKYIESDINLPVTRGHPSIFENVNSNDIVKKNSFFDVVSNDFDFLNQHFSKILVCHPNVTSYLWLENNQIDKCFLTENDIEQYYEPWGYTKEFLRSVTKDQIQRFTEIIKSELDLKNIQQWKQNINDFDIWELRELLSLYWFNRIKDSLTCWDLLKEKYPDIYFISTNDLKYNFSKTVINYLRYFNVTIDPKKLNRLTELEQEWTNIQYHINKDKLVNDIVQNLIDQQDFAWDQLSIIDEAYIQKSLRDQGIEIKCWNLNTFPTSTKEFLPYLEYL
jgi:hypothetical protein